MAISRDLCVVFADVSGSTRLYETLGDAAALAAIGLCIDAMKQATLLNQGQVIKTIGDEVMATFATAAQGMQAACDMQRRVALLPAPANGSKLTIRAGFHCGPTLMENGDVFGDTVNTAGRMAGIAKSGQIITSADTVATLPTLLQASCRPIDALTVKGKAENITVCEAIWQEDAELTMVGRFIAPLAAESARLRLQHGDKTAILGPARPQVSLGRDPASDIVIRDPRASRLHARIERRRDKFVLVDMSSNGSFVSFANEPEIALKREEIILRGSGRIVFGHAWSAATAGEHVDFVIED